MLSITEECSLHTDHDVENEKENEMKMMQREREHRNYTNKDTVCMPPSCCDDGTDIIERYDDGDMKKEKK